MRHELEKELVLPHVRVELATITWSVTDTSPAHPTHALFQRLSRDHSPLRLGNMSAFDLLPRVHAVGFLPAGSTVPLEPIGKPLRVLTCFFDPDFVEARTGLSAERLSRQTAALALLRNKRLEILMQELHAELDHPGPAHEFLIESLTNVMLVEIARVIAHVERKAGRQGIVLALAPWQLLRIEERIKAAPETGYPSLGELAEMCGVSEGHLARAFKVSTGWQIQKYIARQRIATASEMLATGALNCAAIAERLGFSSPGHFSNMFRRMTGQSPSQYRRKALADHAATAN
ncbi:helix-turn-helix transcriptional regulator [Novosphingobium malaysiense]|uniref:HTH araC/xylS-type domain-containing protein n=1 Tax=Novosphingobium malaysiense TaxID=1348853 RepID=A0A0B1ZP46_9SPHN|nr:AraC family transcriptional regulator [Novosphingobium malaysiense]KHK92930.1 hypothetical protein LK12_00615 [Novosphingobium malaysiense]